MSAASALLLGSWIVFWGAGASEKAYESAGGALDEVVVFAYRFGEDGRMIAAGPSVEPLLARLRARRPRGQSLFVSVVNDTTRSGVRVLKDPERISEMLATQESRRRHVDELLALCAGLDGLELDYENLRGQDGPAYVGFVGELSERLHARGQRLHLVAQAKIDDRPGDGARALDWRRLAERVDRLSVMLYNYRGEGSREPGPVCPRGWAQKVIDFALGSVPREKLGVILALHGFSWTEGDKGVSLTYADAQSLARRAGATPRRDPESGGVRFDVLEGGRRKSVWFEDAASAREKMDMAARRGLAAVYLWRLGTGDPALWESLPQNRALKERP